MLRLLKFDGRLTKREEVVLNEFTSYVVNKFISATQQKRVSILVKFINPIRLKGKARQDLIEYNAWMTQNDKYRFVITINSLCVNRRARNPLKRLKDVLLCLGHELVHVKQYVNREMRDVDANTCVFKGKIYHDFLEGEGYAFSPWEIEAYGYEHGLYYYFCELHGNK